MKRGSLVLRFFWITIFGLFFLWLALFLKSQYHITQESKLQKEKLALAKKRESIFYEKLSLLASMAPKEFQDALSNPLFTKELEEIVDKEIDSAFDGVVEQIPHYLDFHYSLRGEYLELFAYSTNSGAKYLHKYLFDASDFEQNIANATQNIFKESNQLVLKTFEDSTQKLFQKVALTEDESATFLEILELQRQSTLGRFNSELSISLRAGGVVAIGAISAMMAKKILSKVALKLSTKMGAAAAAGATGATLCAPTGVGAIICGGVSGIIGWFGSDNIFLEIDEHLSREKFHQELLALIELEREKTKSSIKASFNTLLEKTQTEYTQKIQQSVQERLREKNSAKP